jgi:cell division septation protein DedD
MSTLNREAPLFVPRTLFYEEQDEELEECILACDEQDALALAEEDLENDFNTDSEDEDEDNIIVPTPVTKPTTKPCMNGDKCWSKTCKFSHPRDDAPATAPTAKPATKPAVKPCTFGDKCTRKGCWFSHPRDDAPATVPDSKDWANGARGRSNGAWR